jgi:predicted alpha/beta hydrolase
MPASRFSAIALFCVSVLLLQNASANAQQKSVTGKGEPKDVTLKASGGMLIQATYFESPAGKESPVVILLTGTEGPEKTGARNRRVWQPTALMLQKSGFAVMTVDLRKHGDSVPAAVGTEAPTVKAAADDYPLMVAADLEAVKAFLLEEHAAERLNIRKLGIVSMGSSSMVAAAFTVADWAKTPYPDAPTLAARTPRGQDVRALIMYSPNTNVKGLNANVILKNLKPLQVAVHVVASKDIKEDARHADKVFKAVELKEEQFKEFRKTTLAAGEIRSEGFLEGRFSEATTKDITEFLTKSLKELDAPWVSRKSRLE